jgi:hypothetical protein
VCFAGCSALCAGLWQWLIYCVSWCSTPAGLMSNTPGCQVSPIGAPFAASAVEGLHRDSMRRIGVACIAFRV